MRSCRWILSIAMLAASPVAMSAQPVAFDPPATDVIPVPLPGSGAIEGVVFTPGGDVLPGVGVAVTRVEGGTERFLVTNEHGLFRALLLPIGTYRLVAQVSGFKVLEQRGIVVSADATTQVRATLQVGDVSERVVAPASAAPEPGIAAPALSTIGTGFAAPPAATPGTNETRANATYTFSRTGLAAASPLERADDSRARAASGFDLFAGSVSGALVRDRWFYYAGLRRHEHDLAARRPVTLTAAERTALDVSSTETEPVRSAGHSYVRVDARVRRAHQVTVRDMRWGDAVRDDNVWGRSAPQQAVNTRERAASTSVHVNTTLGNRQLNAFHVQVDTSRLRSGRTARSGLGPAVRVGGITVGGPSAGMGPGGEGFRGDERTIELANTFSLIRSDHLYKIGGHMHAVRFERASAAAHVYTFPGIAAYTAAAAGIDLHGYSHVALTTGSPAVAGDLKRYALFVQDDWQLTPSVKLLYGVRYDRERLPLGSDNAPLAASRAFSSDANNWAPNAALAWAPDENVVVRASTGVFFSHVPTRLFEHVLQLDGENGALLIAGPGAIGAPAYAGSRPPSTDLVPSLAAIDPGFENARTWRSRVSVERRITRTHTASIAYEGARSSHLPVWTDVNLGVPIDRLADGRAVFSPVVTATSRIDPRFDHVYMAQSIGTSRFDGLTLVLTRRPDAGLGFDASYTLARADTNAIFSLDEFPGFNTAGQLEPGRSDPLSLERDRGPAPADVRHALTLTVLMRFPDSYQSRGLRWVLGRSRIDAGVRLASGVPFSLATARDLNGDGIVGDRPLFSGRNALRLPGTRQLDLRYARPVRIGPTDVDVFAQLLNVFNRTPAAAVDPVVAVDAAGRLVAADDGSARAQVATRTALPRELHVGFRFAF